MCRVLGGRGFCIEAIILQVCERCQGSVDKLIESVNHVARVKVHALEHKLQDFEQEAMYEFEELQSELLVAQARTEGLRQLLEDSERRR